MRLQTELRDFGTCPDSFFSSLCSDKKVNICNLIVQRKCIDAFEWFMHGSISVSCRR